MGCKYIFSEIISVNEKIKPEFKKALNYLSKGDELILTKLDRAFPNKNECLKTITKLLNNDISLRTLSGFISLSHYSEVNSSIFKILYELDNLDYESVGERKKLFARQTFSSLMVAKKEKSRTVRFMPESSSTVAYRTSRFCRRPQKGQS